jgi:subtilisin family serine protease
MKLTIIMTALIMSFATIASTPKFDNTRLFVKMTDAKALPTTNLIKSKKHLFGNNYIIHTSNAEKLQKLLNETPEVMSTHKNYYAGKRTLPKMEAQKKGAQLFNFGAFNDPKVGKVWSFNDATKKGVSVNKTYLSPLSVQKEEIIVAVVDTGVDYNHEDLRSVMWKNTQEIADNGIDDDNNGYIDDVYGINTLVRDQNNNATGDPMASHAHGTHVSGTIAAAQNNNVGIAGIASSVKIMAIRTVPDSSDETDADVVESFLYAAENGAKLINCSFGKSHNEGGLIVNETIDHIGQTYGVLVFAAAGNDYGRNIDNRRTFPASFESDYMLVVASTNKRGSLSYFSNIGARSVDLAAPGSDIYSTVPGNSYSGMSGTSMATPTTVGVAAEVLSHFPELSPTQLKSVLMDSVTPISKFQGKMVAPGRVDLFNSLQHTLNNYNTL